MRAKLTILALRLFALLPLPLAHGVGVLIGACLWLIPNRSLRTTRTNIRLCFPDLPEARQRALVRRSLLETGKTIAETGRLWLRDGRRTLSLVREVHGGELMEEAAREGRGAIVVTPHLGAWEIAGLYCASRYDITCLYRPLKMPELEELVNSARSRLGGRYLKATAGSIRELYRTLDRGDVVAMLPDQEPGAGTGVFAPFFGVPAYSMVLLARLAAHADTPVIFVWAERLPLGRGFRLHFSKARPAIADRDIETAVTATNGSVEDCVRQCPEQYQWSYRRFKTRPEGEASFYRRD
jgi:KDO2-lipid IV(A) lauroyltransferase